MLWFNFKIKWNKFGNSDSRDWGLKVFMNKATSWNDTNFEIQILENKDWVLRQIKRFEFNLQGKSRHVKRFAL